MHPSVCTCIECDSVYTSLPNKHCTTQSSVSSVISYNCCFTLKKNATELYYIYILLYSIIYIHNINVQFHKQVSYPNIEIKQFANEAGACTWLGSLREVCCLAHLYHLRSSLAVANPKLHAHLGLRKTQVQDMLSLVP